MKFAPGAWRYALAPLLAAPFAFLFSVGASLACVLLGVAVLAFFRDPQRSPPPTGVLAPADGTVSVLREEDERLRLGTFMNVHNVHVVRSPVSGTVTNVERSPGAYKPAFSKDSDRNERVTITIEPDDSNAGEYAEPFDVTLIAGAFARRIHPYVDPESELDRGERLGHIAFGSRVDVLFPSSVDSARLRSEKGARMRAGETVILSNAANS